MGTLDDMVRAREKPEHVQASRRLRVRPIYFQFESVCGRFWNCKFINRDRPRA